MTTPYSLSKEQLKSSTKKILMDIIANRNKDYESRKDKLSSSGNKEALVDRIWKDWGGDEGLQKFKNSNKFNTPAPTPESDSTTPSPTPTPESDSTTPSPTPIPLPSPRPRPTPIPRPRVPPVKKTKVDTPNIQKKDTKNYEFTDDYVMHLQLELKEYIPGALEPHDADDIDLDELIRLVNTNDFCVKVAKSLKGIYEAKLAKYKKLQENTLQSIKNDIYEKNQMKLTADIDKQDLDRLFPMITINTAFLIKLKTLADLASQKIRAYSSPTVIHMVRNNLLLSITDEEDGIISITGASREKIRNQLCKTLFILSKGYRPFMDAFLNLVFTGPAGVGKTKLAKTYAFVFEKSGILLRGDLIIASPKDMVGEYIGHTAIKSAGVLMKGLEAVILIDEAYQIMPCTPDGKLDKDSKSFGPEAITEIVNFLDKYIGMSIMIVAGYEESMKNCFFGANEGLSRRFPNQISIPPYSNSDLLNIFINGVNKKLGEDIFNNDIVKYIFTNIVRLSQQNKDIFSNQAGDMVNLSSMFLNSYYGSVKTSWDNGLDDQVLIVNSTFNQFLRNKGYYGVWTR